MIKTIKNGSATVQTFVFDAEKEMPSLGVRSKIWQILPTSIASLICLPFGMLLGWPSPTYPKLLSEETSLIPITIDQSAMIAGFLMLGNILGTVSSQWSPLGNKFGIVLAALLTTIGWIILWYASSIYYLLGSRFLVGLACGYGSGQLRMYIRDMCQPNLAATQTKLINFHILSGVIIAYILGCTISFVDFSLVSMIISVVIFALCFLLPHTPKEYLRYGKIHEAKRIMGHLKPNANVDDEINLAVINLEGGKEMSFFQVCRDEKLRWYMGILSLLVILQQCTGSPATIIYTQIIFTASHLPFPEYYAVAYVILYFISNFMGVFYFSTYNKKVFLLVSSFSVSFALILNILAIYFKFNELYWELSFLITMFLFIFLHSIGLGVIPFMLIEEYFPVAARGVVFRLLLSIHSLFALIITKIFQVLYAQYELYVPFCFFLFVSVVCGLFVLYFIPIKAPVLHESIRFSKKVSQDV